MNTEELKRAGMNVNEFLGRVMQNTALVKILVKKFLEDKNYENLKKAIEEGDMKAAEICCHTLKGMCGNMALTELSRLFIKQLALFRNGDSAGAVAIMPEISEQFEKVNLHFNNFVSEI